MKAWNKEFIKPCNPDEVESLLRISDIIDTLWDKQVNLRKEIEEKLLINYLYMAMKIQLKILIQLLGKR